jgi:hypothetical protein
MSKPPEIAKPFALKSINNIMNINIAWKQDLGQWY